jgi:hypothetical protein
MLQLMSRGTMYMLWAMYTLPGNLVLPGQFELEHKENVCIFCIIICSYQLLLHIIFYCSVIISLNVNYIHSQHGKSFSIEKYVCAILIMDRWVYSISQFVLYTMFYTIIKV